MKPTRSELFMRRRANADRLVECFTYGSISDVLDELQQQVWHENPDEIDWKSSLPSPHVPVDAITSLRVTLLAEALLVPREYEFRLAVVCLLLERGAQPCRHTENGRAIEAVLEQLPPSQQEGDYLWHLRHVLDIAVDCRLNRERFLISKHAPFVAEWIDEQLALLEQLGNEAESAAITDLAPAEDATTVDSEPPLKSNRLSDSPLHDYDDLPDYEDVDTEMAEKTAPSRSEDESGRGADTVRSPPLASTPPSLNGGDADADRSALEHARPFRLNDEQSRLASARERAFPTEYQGADSPDTICVSRSRESETSRSGCCAATERYNYLRGRSRSESSHLRFKPSDCQPRVDDFRASLRHHFDENRLAEVVLLPFLDDLIGFGSFPAPFVAGAPLPPVPVEVGIQQFHEQRHVFEYGPRVGHVAYASGEAAKKAREMFDGQRMFPEEIPGTEKIRWKEQAPRV
ncbi:hypothetical protein JCM8115_006185 [Rhodotorula mucilaginosa]